MAAMADLLGSAEDLPDEAQQKERGQRSSENADSSTTSQDTKEHEIKKGKAVLGSTGQMREELVQSAVSFLKHPKVVTSSDIQRRSFLENKGLNVDEINEAFRRLQSPSSNSVRPNTFTSEGVSDHSSRNTQESKVGTKSMDGSVRVEPEPEAVEAAPVLPRHPKSYMEIMEMIQRGEKPDDIQDINDDPPNPDQPISKPRMAPRPKPWEKHDQENCTCTWDLKSVSSDSSKLRPEVQNTTEPASGSNQGHSLQTEVVEGSESVTGDAACSN